jgi:hypothetical protein
MRETDISRKCAGTLLGVALLVGISVWTAWRVYPSASQFRPLPSAAPAPGNVPRPAAPPVERRPVTSGQPLAFQPVRSDSLPLAGAGEALERRAFQLEMENVRLRSRLEDMLKWILANVRGTFPLPEAQMANLRVSPVDEDMAVSADLAELLRLNDRELERLDTAFIGTRSVLQDLELENIFVQEPAENQVVLNIPPYAEEGQLVREELYRELKTTLGTARFDRFLQVAETGLAEKFEHFGEVERTLLFEAFHNDDSGDSQLFVRDQRVVPSPDDPLRQDITASERIVTELPKEYYPYWNWLPEYVTRFSRSN